MNPKYKLSPEQKIELIKILKTRFEKNPKRHDNIKWEDVQKKLESNPEKLWSLNEMERTEGEPDVVGYDEKSNQEFYTQESLLEKFEEHDCGDFQG